MTGFYLAMFALPALILAAAGVLARSSRLPPRRPDQPPADRSPRS